MTGFREDEDTVHHRSSIEPASYTYAARSHEYLATQGNNALLTFQVIHLGLTNLYVASTHPYESCFKSLRAKRCPRHTR